VETRITPAVEKRRRLRPVPLGSEWNEESTVKHSYAVLWGTDEDTGPGRLDPLQDRFELQGRNRRLSIPFADLVGASIARGQEDRLRGLPVLALSLRKGSPTVRIASLEGAAVLHELADRVKHSGLTVFAT
jgi:hypothetical protein